MLALWSLVVFDLVDDLTQLEYCCVVLMGDLLRLPPDSREKKILARFCVEKRNFVIRVLLCVVAVFFEREKKKTVTALLYFP